MQDNSPYPLGHPDQSPYPDDSPYDACDGKEKGEEHYLEDRSHDSQNLYLKGDH